MQIKLERNEWSWGKKEKRRKKVKENLYDTNN